MSATAPGRCSEGGLSRQVVADAFGFGGADLRAGECFLEFGISVGDMLDLERECERDEHDSGCEAGEAISSFEEGRSIPPLLGVL
jgi:hypothetical protein